MKKNLLLWKILLMVFFNLLAINSFAQVANYTFSQSSGTYTALPTSTTLFTTAWDDNVGSVTIPFTYKFNGVGYTAASVNSNGYITFGTTPSGSTNYSAISSTTAYDGAIAAFSRNLINNTSTIVYGTEGVTPNRVFVIQWNDARRYNFGGLADVMNFQIRLYETSNKAEIRYGSNSTSETANTSKGQVGLRGADNTDFNNRNAETNNTAWASLNAGTLNNDNVNYKSTVVPASGLTFTWTPFTCPTFSSTISIGGATTTAGSLYPSLTAAVADLSRCSISQPTTLSLNSSYNSTAETFPIVIPSISGSSTLNTLTIKPAVGVSPTISGVAPTSNALIKIYNSNTIIDGSNTPAGTTKNLSITNTNTGNSWITAIVSTGTTPITNVTLKNTNLTNGNQGSLGVIISDGTIASAGYFNNITIQNNSIQKASYGLYINGNTAVGNGSGLLITGNAFNGTGTNSVLNGIAIYGVDGSSTVSNNTINAANSLYNINSTGIILGAGANNVTISGNTISGVVNTVSSTYVATGILVNTGISAGTIQINNNNISGISSLGGYVDGAAGIDIGGATPNVNIYNNKISNIKNNNRGSAAIFLGSSSTAANTLLYNNMIWDVAGLGFASAASDNGHGIYVNSGAGYKIYYNSVNMTTNQTAGVSAALYVSSSISLANAIDMRNNIFANNQSANTRYAIYSDAAKTVFSNINYNNYYSKGSLGFLGSARATLANWQTATGKDVNSLNITPPFISSADLHLTGCSLLESAATPIAGITTDIDADLRSSTNPDIGADESKMYFTGANLTTPTLWNVNNNWSSFNIPTSDKCVNIPSGKTAVVNITTAVAKKVTVDAGGYLTISPNQALTVTDVFTNSNVPNLVAASSPKQYYVTIENDGNLLQTNKVTNVGAIAARREINIRDHNQYNYAVSPLWNTNLNTNIYEDQTSHNLSNAPFTLYHNEATNKFYTSSGAYIAGRGLAVKEPATGTGKINMLFTGVPVNGSVPYTLVNSTPLDAVHGYNLIGNPYPSNLDLITFYNENNTTGKLDPTFYFWDSTANSQTSQAGSGYGGEAYAKFNVSTPPGVGTPTIATGDAGFAGTKSATRYVKVGQAFMARTTAGSLAVSFENTQRTGNSATGFFGKGAQEAAPFDRYWLNMISPANIISELAVVYFEGGNDAYTQDDSRSLLGSDAVYSIVEGQPIAINGKNSFAQTDVVPLGTKHFANGNYTIALKDQKDGVFANGQSIYLKDKQSGIITNLSEGNYTFAAIAGENTGRFEIIYQPEIVLATDGIDKEQIIVYRENNDFIIKSPKEMKRVEVYDPSGKLIKVLLPNSKSAVIESTTLINGMYILKIELKDGEQYMKKIRK
jgi:hypothetical protein